MCVCVCVFGIHVLKNCCWKMILKVQNVVWIFGWVACFIAFVSVFFLSWKTDFKLSRHLVETSSTPGYLSRSETFSYCNLDRSSTAGWIDRESSWTLDNFSIVGGSIKLLFLCLCLVPRHLLDSFIYRHCYSRRLPRQMARHLSLSRITKDLYKGQAQSELHFLSISLLISLSSHLPNHSLSLQTTFQVIFKLFQGFSSLGMFLFSHLHAFSCFET